MNRSDLIKIFKAAPWRGMDEAQAFANQVIAETELGPKEIEELLEVLDNRKLQNSQAIHELRCAVFDTLAARVIDPSVFVIYVKALKSADARTRKSIGQIMPKVNNFHEHERLCEHLRSNDDDLRQVTVSVLKQVGGKTVLSTLTAMAGDRDFPGRNEALNLAVQIGGHHAVPALTAALQAGKPQEKVRALQLLGDTRYMAKAVTQALKVIYGAFEDPHEKVVAQAVVSFSHLCTEENYFEYCGKFFDADNLTIVKAAVEGLRHFSSRRAISVLERKLRAGPNLIRLEVINVLEVIATDDVLPPLVEALGNKQLAVRNRAGEVLSKLSQTGKLDVARVVIWLLRSRDVNVRRMAVDIARTVRDTSGELWPKLLAFLRDEDWWVRERVTDALVEMAGRQLTRHMVSYLSDPVDVIRRFAIEVLMRLKDPAALGALVSTARDDTDWWVRERAVEAVAAIGDPRAVPYVVELMRRVPELQIICLEALGDLDAKSAAPHVGQLLALDDPDTRIAALRCLTRLGDTSLAPAVKALLTDGDPKIVRAAREVLLHWNLTEELDQATARAVSLLDRLLLAVAQGEGDDLILTPEIRPFMKRMGKAVPLTNTAFSRDQIRALLLPHLTLTQVEELDALHDVDFSYEVKSEGLRFRANIFHERGGVGAVFRIIKGTFLDLDKLGLPPVFRTFGDLPYGLVLVGGPTGSGKSTTLAALIDYINRTSARHIISLEDPIEVVHRSQKGLVNQREVGTHTKSFASALRANLREDPDVILVGEMRDLETISFAVTAAETGHLVFGTVHTVSADTTVDRLVNAFPPRQQEQVRATLADSLRAVVCQYLLKSKDGKGRVLAAEVMINNDAIANLIRKGKTFQIPSIVSTSREAGMRLMDQELMRLYKDNRISAEEAYMKSAVKKDFEELVASQGENSDELMKKLEAQAEAEARAQAT